MPSDPFYNHCFTKRRIYSFVFVFSASPCLCSRYFKEKHTNGVAKMSKPLPYHSHSLLFTLLFSCYLNVPVFISAHHFACIQAKLHLCHYHLVFQAQLCLNDKVTPHVCTLRHPVSLFFIHAYYRTLHKELPKLNLVYHHSDYSSSIKTFLKMEQKRQLEASCRSVGAWLCLKMWEQKACGCLWLSSLFGYIGHGNQTTCVFVGK